MTAEPRLRSARTAPVQPGDAPGLGLVRMPAFWIVLALLAAGAFRMATITGRFVGAYPIASIAASLTAAQKLSGTGWQ